MLSRSSDAQTVPVLGVEVGDEITIIVDKFHSSNPEILGFLVAVDINNDNIWLGPGTDFKIRLDSLPTFQNDQVVIPVEPDPDRYSINYTIFAAGREIQERQRLAFGSYILARDWDFYEADLIESFNFFIDNFLNDDESLNYEIISTDTRFEMESSIILVRASPGDSPIVKVKTEAISYIEYDKKTGILLEISGKTTVTDPETGEIINIDQLTLLNKAYQSEPGLLDSLPILEFYVFSFYIGIIVLITTKKRKIS